MSIDFKFEEIGLETRDKRVYEALVANPQTSLRNLAALTGINRGSVYESIKNLAEAGLVGSIEAGKQKRLIASDPGVIIELLKERQQRARKAERLASQYIHTLASNQKTDGDHAQFATYYEDDEGIAAILRDVIATCSSLGQDYRAISTKHVRDYMYQNFPNFTQRRIHEQISVRVIAVGQGGSKDALSERKWLEATRGDGPNCYTLIYGDKTAFISIDEANVLSGIVVTNTGVAQLQKELFDRLWQTL
jgi:sugar-specific transcriptional regulator TrmB